MTAGLTEVGVAPTAVPATDTSTTDEIEWCAQHLEALCHVDSTSGHEARILPILMPILDSMGAKIIRQTVTTNRVNVLAIWGRPQLLFQTHLDTVAPFVPPNSITGGLAGRGTCDAKGQIVTQLAVIQRLLANGRRNFAWLGVVGEETDSAGAEEALSLASQLPGLKALIGGEPTANRLATAQPGFLHLTLSCHGRRGHGSVGEPSENALWQLLDWLTALRSRTAGESARFGRESFNLGSLEGGEAPNVVAGSATAEIVARTVPGSTFLAECRQLAPPQAEVTVRLEEPPQALSEWAGLEGGPVPFGSDMPRLAALIPKVATTDRVFLIGPGSIRVAHTDDEHLLWHDLEIGIDRLDQLARGLLGPDRPRDEALSRPGGES